MNNAIEVFRGFLPPRRRGLRGAIERLLRVQVEGDDPSYREIYNPDRTRKFIFSESNDDENLSQLNIRLEVQVGISWVEFMGAMWRREDGKEHAYCIEIEARTLREECCEHATYRFEYATGAKKTHAGMWGTPFDEHLHFLPSKTDTPFFHEDALPEYIDFEGTTLRFLRQARNLDFSNPVLVPKPMLP